MINLKEISTHLGWTEDRTERFYSRLFELILTETKDPLLHTIHLQEFGKFYVKKITIDKIISAYIKQIRNGENVERNRERIKSLWKAREIKSYKRI